MKPTRCLASAWLAVLLVACHGGGEGGGAPAPADAATATIGAAGGTLATPSGIATLVIPPGALLQPTAITIEPDTTDYAQTGVVPRASYRFGPSGMAFLQPVRLTLRYDPTLLAPDENEADLSIARIEADGQEFLLTPASDVVVDTAAKTISASFHSFSAYGAIVLRPPCLTCIPTLVNDTLTVETQTESTIGLRWDRWINDPDWFGVRLVAFRADGAWDRSRRDPDYDAICDTGLAAALGWSAFMPQCIGMVTWEESGPNAGANIRARFERVRAISVGQTRYMDANLPTGVSFTYRIDRFATTATLFARYPRLRLYAGSSNATVGATQPGVPNPPPATANIIAVAAGGRHSLALDDQGRVYAWGDNSQGQLGDGTRITRRTPGQVPNIVNVQAIAAGFEFSLALLNDGTVWAWGDNEFGQLGDGTGADSSVPVLVINRNPAPNNVVRATAIAAGQHHAIALGAPGGTINLGGVFAWGRNQLLQLAEGAQGGAQSNAAFEPFSVGNVVHLASGWNHVLTFNGGANPVSLSWGSNANFQLGRVTPAPFAGTGNFFFGISVAQFAAGQEHSLYLHSLTRLVSAWGSNADGQLGVSGVGAIAATVGVPGLSSIASIAAGANHSLAVDTSGNVWSWGRNVEGQLGQGSVGPRGSVAPVAGLSGVARVSGGQAHSLAVTTNGQVYAWGDNSFGQLGDGGSAARPSPVLIPVTP